MRSSTKHLSMRLICQRKGRRQHNQLPEKTFKLSFFFTDSSKHFVIENWAINRFLIQTLFPKVFNAFFWFDLCSIRKLRFGRHEKTYYTYGNNVEVPQPNTWIPHLNFNGYVYCMRMRLRQFYTVCDSSCIRLQTTDSLICQCVILTLKVISVRRNIYGSVSLNFFFCLYAFCFDWLNAFAKFIFLPLLRLWLITWYAILLHDGQLADWAPQVHQSNRYRSVYIEIIVGTDSMEYRRVADAPNQYISIAKLILEKLYFEIAFLLMHTRPLWYISKGKK